MVVWCFPPPVLCVDQRVIDLSSAARPSSPRRNDSGAQLAAFVQGSRQQHSDLIPQESKTPDLLRMWDGRQKCRLVTASRVQAASAPTDVLRN